jgi:hypothetical protein
VLDDAYTISYFVKIYLQAERKRPGALVPAPPIRGDGFPSALHCRVKTGGGESNATKDVAFLVACALTAAIITGSPHIIIATQEPTSAIPF